MPPALPEPASGKWLLVIAAPAEWSAVAPALSGRAGDALPEEWTLVNCSRRFDAVRTGVGKANAAGGTARVLDPARHAGVVCLGIAGALPGSGLGPGHVVIATRSIMGDEGVRTPEHFVSLASLNFPSTPEGDAISASPELVNAVAHLGDAQGPVATISTCAGDDALALDLRARTGALAEAMEGAAVGVAARRVLGAGCPFIELRVISNTTGNRSGQRWDLPGALEALARVARAL